MHNNGLRSWHKMTNLLIDKTHSTARIFIVCGVAIGIHGRTPKMSASLYFALFDRSIKCSYYSFNSRSWYDEVKQYTTWNVEPKGAFKAGQFSQVVWKSSKELGVGVGRTKSGKLIVVASYWPRGNIIGQFLQNVKKSN